jgi:hypothetical protein
MFKKFTDWFAENGVNAISHAGWVMGIFALVWVIYLIATKSRGVIIQ